MTRLSAAAAIGVLLALALAGTGAAFLAAGPTPDVVNINSVTVTGPNGTVTYAVTETQEATQKVMQTRVVTRRGEVTTLRRERTVPGPVERVVAPGRTVAGPTKVVTVTRPGRTKTVTVTGPAVTTTVVETQVVTDVVTVTEQVTVTETVEEGDPDDGL